MQRLLILATKTGYQTRAFADAARRLGLEVVYGTDRAKFGGNPEAVLQGQRICVTGFVSFFRQRPEMILSHPAQVSYVPPQSIAQVR